MVNILVTSVGRGAGQAVIKSLRMAPWEARIIGTDTDAWATGLYAADKSYLVPSCTDVHFIEKISDICVKEDIDLLIPNYDPELPVFSAHKSSFAQIGVPVLISDLNIMKICRNKLDTYRFFQDQDLPFVETQLVSSLFEKPAVAYPLFVKPIGGTGSSEIDILFDESDLDKYKNQADKYIAQTYLIPAQWNLSSRSIRREQVMRHNQPIQKDEVSVQHLVSQGGEIISTFMSISSLKHGIPVHITPIWDPEVYEISRKMVEALIPQGLLGPINLECKITAQGIFFYEINPRFTTLSAVRAMMGFNECAAMVGDLLFNQSAAALQSQLKINFASLCTRYISELVVDSDSFQTLIKQGELDNADSGTQLL